MKKSRREFLSTSLALGLAPVLNANPVQKLFESNKNEKKLKILILGGTSFLGPHQIAYALKRGREVSIFTRGKTSPKIHQELEGKKGIETIVSTFYQKKRNLEDKNRRAIKIAGNIKGKTYIAPKRRYS